MVAQHAIRTGLPYELPNIPEVATIILSHYVRSGEHLYATTDHPSTWNWTQCQDLVAYTGGDYPVVGGLLRGVLRQQPLQPPPWLQHIRRGESPEVLVLVPF